MVGSHQMRTIALFGFRPRPTASVVRCLQENNMSLKELVAAALHEVDALADLMDRYNLPPDVATQLGVVRDLLNDLEIKVSEKT